jgi:uncharacterized protein (DUF362 family)
MKRNELHVIYGTDIKQMTYDLLTKIDLAKDLKPTMRIALKPNFVVAKEAASGATTHPEIAEGVIKYLQDHGMQHIAIMEGSWVGDQTKRAFKICGYDKLAAKYKVPLYDLKDDKYVVRQVEDIKMQICQKPLLETDFLINLPVLKAHCQTGMTCALKNMKGCLTDAEKRHFHQLGLMKPIAYLNTVLRPQLTIVDAICGDLTFEEGGNPVRMDRLIAGVDPVLVDTYGCSLLGFDVSDIEYIGIAESKGVGSTDLASAELHEYNTEAKTQSQFVPSRLSQRLGKNVTADKACSACYGSLIHALHRLDEQGIHISKKMFIGQGFRGKSENGLGIGSCTHCFAKSLAGCPPTAKAMVEFLRKNNNHTEV